MLAAGELELISAPTKDAPGVVRPKMPFQGVASIFGLYVDMARLIGGIHFYMIAPIGGGAEFPLGIYRDEIHECVSWIPVPRKMCRTSIYPVVGGLDSAFDLFAYRPGAFNIPVDAIFGSSLPFVAKRATMLMSDRQRVVPAFVRHETAYTKEGSVIEEFGRPGKDARRADLVASESVGIGHVFLSKQQLVYYQNLFMLERLAPSAIQRILKNTIVCPNGIDIELMDRVRNDHGIEDRGRSVGSWSRPTTQKGTAEVVNLYEKMLQCGQVDPVRVTWNKDLSLDKFMGRKMDPRIEFNGHCHREEYLKIAAKTAVSFYNSDNEGDPICLPEMMSVGCIPVLSDYEWVHERLREPWPLVAKNAEEAQALVLYALENQDTLRPKAIEYARKHHDARRNFKAMIDFVQSRADAENAFSTMTEAKFKAWCDKSAWVKKIDAVVGDRKDVPWLEVVRASPLPTDTMGRLIALSHHDIPAFMFRRYGMIDENGTTPHFRIPS